MKPNKYGCRVSGDVCLIHEEPLICKHGCTCSKCNCEENRGNIEEKSGNLGEARNAVLVDGCVAMDERRYLSIVSDMAQYWSAEDPKEKIAMKWMAIKIYAAFNVSEKKATVS